MIFSVYAGAASRGEEGPMPDSWDQKTWTAQVGLGLGASYLKGSRTSHGALGAPRFCHLCLLVMGYPRFYGCYGWYISFIKPRCVMGVMNYTCIYIYIYTYLCTGMYVYIYIYTIYHASLWLVVGGL